MISVYPWLLFAILLVTSLVTVLATTPLARRIAMHLGAIDYPNARRINTRPTPRMGGIAIFCGLLTSALILYACSENLDFSTYAGFRFHLHVNYPVLGLSFAIIFLTGLLDDKFNLKPAVKLLGQVAAGCVAAAGGLVFGMIVNPFAGGFAELGWVDYPITVIYLVAFANIINLIDGLDGLASGITCISSLTLFVLSILANKLGAAALAIMLVGCTLGFLRYNFYPAKIFLGDSGSLLLGFALGSVSLLSVTRVAGLTTVILPIVMAGVPIADTFFAIVRRRRAHVSIGQADKGHIHHRLIEQGFDQRQAVLVMYLWTAALCIGTLIMDQVPVTLRIAIFVFLIVASTVFAFKLKLFNPVLLHRENPEYGEDDLVSPDDPGFEQAREKFEREHGTKFFK